MRYVYRIFHIFSPYHHKGYEKQAVEQFLKVNSSDIVDLQDEMQRVRETHQRLSSIAKWELDLSFIEEQGYKPNIE